MKNDGGFDYLSFWDDVNERNVLAVSKKRYSKSEAAEIAKNELETDNLVSSTGYVKYGFGANEFGENVRGWWLVNEGHRGAVSVYTFWEE